MLNDHCTLIVLYTQVTILQKVLEHMLAQFSFFNFGYQVRQAIGVLCVHDILTPLT